MLPPHRFVMTKGPSENEDITTIEESYSAPFICDAIARYVVHINHPDYSNKRIKEEAEVFHLRGHKLPVYRKAKFWLGDNRHPQIMSDEWDVVHAAPPREDTLGRSVPARFDTVIIDDGRGDTEYEGVRGYRVGQVKVIFSLPDKSLGRYKNRRKPAPYLAYVEWFTAFPKQPHPDHRLYKIKRSMAQGDRLATVISLAHIRRSIHLFPKFGKKVPQNWTSDNVLDRADSFFVNSVSDRHAFATIR